MDRTTPVRKPHTSTADLLTWPELPPADSPALPSSASRSAPRSHQPSDGISKVVFGGQVTDEEVESLNKRKPCSGYKMKEMTGSGIFVGNEGDEELESGSANPSQNKTGIRMYQQTLAGISHISFGEEGSVSPKKPTTVPEVAKQRELSGNLESDADAKLKKQLSDAKCKELSGHDIFAPPPEILPRPTTARTLDLKGSIEIGEPDSRGIIPGEEPSVKTAKKIYDKKFSELSGNDIFKGDVPPSSTEKPLSVAKLREMSGNDIFADGKVETRDYLGGVRKPPGGESSIALV
ncbi:uncharacterized protein LOC101215119 [Cucumis sativus]|uniref:DUF4057 domain-containing protein n=1 Tax=Cucumis sativus TaxID=3659 RepID=A0A0A0LK08_CUCSA|nr:uncharacterized protein LOC101215119 [Cucumis sativus]KGN62250.1 hypothetical protein Csa_018791 [Cucumis sativus]